MLAIMSVQLRSCPFNCGLELRSCPFNCDLVHLIAVLACDVLRSIAILSVQMRACPIHCDLVFIVTGSVVAKCEHQPTRLGGLDIGLRERLCGCRRCAQADGTIWEVWRPPAHSDCKCGVLAVSVLLRHMTYIVPNAKWAF